ncbi:MAG: AAA family ATPase [Eubacterium sp.]|nr:AAA family ATPase [Eubacterium sp.]
MNIKEAKEEIIRTVNAYRRKDETGAYEIPAAQQRPVLLMGPPGIGKTAIMEQVAQECGIGLVSYTITHHTRQSAIGLPLIAHRTFGGQDYAVTEYTMSEIVASVYEQIERTGIEEGILFLDEINCVSETLTPTMLQFLQYKTFGTHKVPDGYVIVTAGNPPQYNRSARTFDIVTLDRVKRMEIEADFGVWKEYAYRRGVHGSVLSYLEIRQKHFYVIRTELEGRTFVTARGWEDLSRMLSVYEKMGEPVTEQMVVQYVQDPEIARDFALYYALYQKYKEVYRIEAILDGASPDDPDALREIPFDEKLSLIRLLADGLHQTFTGFAEQLSVQEILFDWIREIRDSADQPKTAADARQIPEEFGKQKKAMLEWKAEAGMLSDEQTRGMRRALLAWDELAGLAAEAPPERSGQDLNTQIKTWFSAREEQRMEYAEKAGTRLTNAFAFIERVYGSGQEMVMLLTELNADWYCLQFISAYGNDAYDKYNQLLLLRDRQSALRQEILRLA